MHCKRCRDPKGNSKQMVSGHDQDYNGITFWWKCPDCKQQIESCRVTFPNPEQVEAYPYLEVKHV